MSDADEESRRMATLSGWNNSGALSSSSLSAPIALRVVASTVTEPTLNMPTTPAQLTEMIASALTNQQPVNRDLFNSANSGSISNASIGPEIENIGGHIIRPIINEVPANLYWQTSSITNEALKRSRLSDTNTDNTKRKAAILIILKSEDLLTLITKVRSKPIKTSSNPNGYSPKRCITNIKGEEETINSDDEYLNRHDINRLYLAMTICISYKIQFLCPVAIATMCGITLWAFSNNHLFGTAYKNILMAMDRIKQWRIDPTKHFQSEVHNLMVLMERANETNDNTMPDKNILAILNEEISKDPREALRITALNCQEQQVPLEEVLTRLLSSAGAAPMNRTVKIHSMESKTVTPISFRFQVNKCLFGDNCKYRHIKDHNFIPRGNKENKDNNGADKIKVTPKIPNRKFTPNNHNNRLVGPPRGKSLDGHAPSYSTMQIRTLKLLANVNSINDSDDNNKVIVENNVLTNRDSNSWMFDNNSPTSSTNLYLQLLF